MIGCGPAGSFFVLELLRLGVSPERILMFDRARFPRPKLCGGGITFRGTETLAQLQLEPPGRWQSRELALSWAGKELTIREPGPQWLVDRSLFDDYLLEQCRRRGVTVNEGRALTAVDKAGLAWWLSFADGSVAACDWLVAADGAASTARRLLNVPAGRIGRLVEGVFDPLQPRPASTTLAFSFDPLAQGIPGYGWIFPYPEPAGELRYKIGVMDGMGVAGGRQLREWTLAYAAANGFRLRGELAGWTEHYFGLDNVGHRPGLLLVGEAYGIDALLGEGITPALEHARYAAGRLAPALAARRLTIGGFERDFVLSEAGWNQFFQRFLADRLYGQAGRRWLDVLYASRLLRRLGQGGEVAYGRMARRPVLLVLALLEGLLRRR